MGFKERHLIEENMVKAIVKTPENANELGDIDGRISNLKEIHSRDNLTPEEIQDAINRHAFLKLSQMNPYEGKPLSEKDKLLAWEANRLLGIKDPKIINSEFQKLKQEFVQK